MRSSYRAYFAVGLTLLVLFAVGNAWAQGDAAQNFRQDCRAGVQAPLNMTPVTLRILQTSLIPVPATDGFVHLAYAAQVTNVSPFAVVISSMVPADPATGFEPSGINRVVDRDGLDVTGKVFPFRHFIASTGLEPGGSAVSFFDVRYGRPQDVPRSLAHRISVKVDGLQPPEIDEATDPIPVGCLQPIVLAPPLAGPRWWNSNGCCGTYAPHRGAVLPFNGELQVPEQFSIDFEQLTPARGCCTGPVTDLSSWPFFGAPVLAAADGVVVEAVDGMPEQVPGKNPDGIKPIDAPGNHIIEYVGGGYYILYAHLKTNTVPGNLVPGARLRQGQQLGQLGNSGNSSAPHLHFQVMDRPSALDAVGLPFVFDRQVLQGQVIGTDRAANDTYDMGGALTVEYGTPRLVRNRMPYEGQVFSFDPK